MSQEASSLEHHGAQRRRPSAYLASELSSRSTPQRQADLTSRQMDPFADAYASGGVVQPPYSLHALSMMLETSDSVSKCIAAIATNTTLLGWKLEPPEENPHPVDPDDPKMKEIEAEEKRIRRFLKYISVDVTFDQVRYRRRTDLEATGNGYLEVIRSGDGIVRIEHLPSYTMRIGTRQKEHVEFTRWERSFETGGWESVSYLHRPRKFVQERDGERVWFKEFGDARIMSWKTGEYSESVPISERATEVIHTALYANGRSPYGIPRWIAAVQQAVGRSEAAEKNLSALNSNGIPRAVLMMYGAGSAEEIDADIKRIGEMYLKMQRRDNDSDLLIIPMAPKEVDAFSGEKPQQTRGEFVKLNDLQQQDAMFTKYSEQAENDVIGTFRLPPIAVGKSADYTRSTAETAKRVAQEQVYGPESRQDEHIVNDLIFSDSGFRWWKFRAEEAPSSDESVAGAVVTALSESAGITPRMARQLAGRFLGIKIGGNEQPWDDIPSTLLRQWVGQGLVPPPEDLLTALGILEPIDGSAPADSEPATGGTKGNPDRSVERSRRLQRVLRHQFGDVEAETAATVARLVIRGLLEARKQLEELDDGDSGFNED